MSTTAKDRRRDARHEIANRTKARLEIERPDGTRRQWPLVEVSVSGLSFVASPGDAAFTPGARLEGASLVLGDCRVEGALSVIYVSPKSATESLCGGMFYPRSVTHQARLANVLSGMDLVADDE